MSRKERLMATVEIWTYRAQSAIGTDMTGFTVEAIDGKIGKVDEGTQEVGGSYIVVHTGRIFGKNVLLPAGVIQDVDLDTETVFVNRTKDEIKNAPEFDEDRYRGQDYRNEVGGYYGPGGRGYREPDVR
jgi:hypothetical protein